MPRPPPDEKPVLRRAQPTGPPAPVRWWIAPGIAGQLPDRGPRQATVSLAFALERVVEGQRLGLRFSAGARNLQHNHTAEGSATLVQLPLRLDAYLVVPIGFGRLEGGLGGGLDVMIVTSTEGMPAKSTSSLRAYGGEALAAWSLPMPHNIFVRAGATGGAFWPKVFVTDEKRTVSFQTPRMRLELGIELGLWFR